MMAVGLSAGQEVGVSIEGTAASMVMEWMVGDLGNFMDLSLMLSKWDNALNNLYDMYVMLSIARGMKKLHTSGLLHRDLKALNILHGRRQLQKVMAVGLSADPEVGYISKVLGVYIQGATVSIVLEHMREGI
ncbi:unnamed protein product [Sphagnum tenellum]